MLLRAKQKQKNVKKKKKMMKMKMMKNNKQSGMALKIVTAMIAK